MAGANEFLLVEAASELRWPRYAPGALSSHNDDGAEHPRKTAHVASIGAEAHHSGINGDAFLCREASARDKGGNRSSGPGNRSTRQAVTWSSTTDPALSAVAARIGADTSTRWASACAASAPCSNGNGKHARAGSALKTEFWLSRRSVAA
jgi:hypothetical protein